MIKLENTEVFGWEAAIRGMRNPMNSWEKSDSSFSVCECEKWPHEIKKSLENIGPNDKKLMLQLANGGPVHAKYRRMITVYVDITAPLYWWKEFDTYKVGTVANSCSTMHKIAAKEFTIDDFSDDRLDDIWGYEPEVRNMAPVVEFTTYTDTVTNYVLGPSDILNLTIKMLNRCRELYLSMSEKLKRKDLTDSERKDIKAQQKCYWWQMIQLLPTSYNQKRTVMLNYEVLTNMYHSRKNHKLDEWRTFCEWIEGLPYSEIITGEQKDVKNFIGTPAAMGLSFNDQRELCGIPPISHEIVTPDTLEMLKKKLSIASPSEAVRGKRRPTACELCNIHGCGDSDEEVCKKCQFYLGSKWAKKSDK